MTEADNDAELSSDMAVVWQGHPREGFFVSEGMVERVADYIRQKARAGKTTTKQEIIQAFSYSFMTVTEAVNILIAEGTVCTVPPATSDSVSRSSDETQ